MNKLDPKRTGKISLEAFCDFNRQKIFWYYNEFIEILYFSLNNNYIKVFFSTPKNRAMPQNDYIDLHKKRFG